MVEVARRLVEGATGVTNVMFGMLWGVMAAMMFAEGVVAAAKAGAMSAEEGAAVVGERLVEVELVELVTLPGFLAS